MCKSWTWLVTSSTWGLHSKWEIFYISFYGFSDSSNQLIYVPSNPIPCRGSFTQPLRGVQPRVGYIFATLNALDWLGWPAAFAAVRHKVKRSASKYNLGRIFLCFLLSFLLVGCLRLRVLYFGSVSECLYDHVIRLKWYLWQNVKIVEQTWAYIFSAVVASTARLQMTSCFCRIFIADGSELNVPSF